MLETIEIRTPDSLAEKYLPRRVGVTLGRQVRKIEVPTTDPLVSRIHELLADKQARRDGFFVSSWDVRRSYSPAELEAAELFHLIITAVCEHAGEDCGTDYDESTACPRCGAGRTQRSELILDLRKAPKRKDIARTIADEWVVSQRLAELITEAQLTGLELRAVRHRARYQDDPVDLTLVPSGRALLERAQAAGLNPQKWAFTVWLNGPEQRALYDQAEAEHADLLRIRARGRGVRPRAWYQIVATAPPVSIARPTAFGNSPFDPDTRGMYRCPEHVNGLNLLTDVTVARSSWDGSDLAITKQLVGWRQGVLVPKPLILISPRFRELLDANNVRGYRAEVAHFA